MRPAAPVLLAIAATLAGPLAGCFGGEEGLPDLRAFTATYERSDGSRSTVEFGEVRTVLGADGLLHRAYMVRWQDDGWTDSWSEQALDAQLRPVRVERCWVWDEGRHCGHREIDFQNGSALPEWGIAGPWLRPDQARERDGLVTVESSREGLAAYEYDYRPGELWAQRFARRAPDFDFEEEVWHLASIDVGPRVTGEAEEWPLEATAAPGPAPVGFPGGDRMFAPFPFTLQQGVDALAADPDASKALDGGCVASVWYWAIPPGRDPPANSLPPLQPREEDRMFFGVTDAAGRLSNWDVRLMRDTFGETSLQVEAGNVDGPGPLRPFACGERAGVAVAADAFAEALPETLRSGMFSQFAASWYAGRHDGVHLRYSMHWEPEGGTGHWRSGDLDASTGLWTRFTFLPGDRVDPAEPEQSG